MSGVRIIIRNPPGGDLVELGTQYIYRGGWEIVNRAEEGSGGRSTLLLDDPDFGLWSTLGLNIGGRQQIRLVDIDSDRIVAFGFVGKRGIKRKYDDKGHPIGRAWSVDIWDANAILQRRILTHKGADRPKETDLERIEALFDLPEWGIIDTFLLGPSETTMSKHDYRGMTVGQYIADCGQMTRKNWWVDIVEIDGSDQQTFWYGRDTRDEYESTLFISNDLADIDEDVTFAPSKDTEWTVDPERVYDGIWASDEKHSIYRRRQATAEVFGLRWDTSQQWPTIHDKERLIHKAQSMLDRFKDEQEIVTTAIEVPSTHAHLVRAGMRIPLKLTHVDSLASFTDCRILSRGIAPIYDGSWYRISLTLEPIEPGEPPPPPATCSAAVSGAVTATIEDQAYVAPGVISMPITPAAGVDSVIIAGAIAAGSRTPKDSLVVGDSPWTTTYTTNQVGGNGPAFGAMYLAVDGSGAESVDATYDPGFSPAGQSKWAVAAAAIETTATSPVQTANDADSNGFDVTFASPVTPGNMIVIAVGVRSNGVIDNPMSHLYPTDGRWIILAGADASSPGFGSGHSVWVVARCVEEGDPDTYSGVGTTLDMTASAMEWVIS